MKVVDESTKRRLKRSLRRRQRGTMESVAQADDKLERLLIRRFDRLVSVRRFVFLWLLLFGLMIFVTYGQIRGLSPYYQSLQPISGGLYTEGLLGNFTNANPLYATGAADETVSRLIFSGLFKYDEANRLVGDLATSYDLDDTQQIYTVHLRHNVVWQDGAPFTADDVVFTYETIQDVDAQSSLYNSWQGISVTMQDDYTVVFSLPNSLSSFPYSLTNGIVPKHLLSGTPVEQLRSSPFNTAPVGTGPFAWKFVDVTGDNVENREQRISMSAFDNYYAGKPKLDGFSIITYSDDRQLIAAFEKKQLNAMSGLDQLPADLEDDGSIQVYTTPLTTAVMAFFNNSKPALDNVDVRKALAMGVDRRKLVDLLGSPVQLVNGPLLKSQLGYDAKIVEPSFNASAAAKLLDAAGYKKDASGRRLQDGQQLTLSISAQNTANYTHVAQFLQQQWNKLGVKINISYYSSDDLQTSVIGTHSYDILLYGINIGVDPDVYAYWDSSQASLTSQGRSNLSEYKSKTADQALEAGRTRSDPAVRAAKYKAFLKQWVHDMPAVGLYQPNYLYVSRGPVFNYERKADNLSIDRFYNVANWEIRQQRKTNQ
jgi:peptide/nickel transport system substrate-binding protein